MCVHYVKQLKLPKAIHHRFRGSKRWMCPLELLLAVSLSSYSMCRSITPQITQSLLYRVWGNEFA